MSYQGGGGGYNHPYGTGRDSYRGGGGYDRDPHDHAGSHRGGRDSYARGGYHESDDYSRYGSRGGGRGSGDRQGGYNDSRGGRYDRREGEQHSGDGYSYSDRSGGYPGGDRRGGRSYEDRGRYDDGGRGHYESRGGGYDGRGEGYRGRGGSYEGRGGGYRGRGGGYEGRGEGYRGRGGGGYDQYGGPPPGRGGFRGGRGGGFSAPPGPIEMLTNHYKVKIKAQNAIVIKHLIEITSEIDENFRLNFGSRRELFERACSSAKVDAVVAYDGDRIMISQQPVKFEIELMEKRVRLKVCCTPQDEVDLASLTNLPAEQTKEALQALDIIMKAAARLRCEPGKAQTFLHNSEEAMRPIPRENVCLWMGHWQSCQVMQTDKYSNLSGDPSFQTTLILNAASSAAMRDMPLNQWTRDVMGESLCDLKGLSPPWITAFEGKIRGYKFETRHILPRRYVKIASVSQDTAKTATFDYEGEATTVENYFRRRYQITLRFPDAPLVLLAPRKKNLLMPAELLYLSRQKLRQQPRDHVKRFVVENMIMEPGVRAQYISNALDFVFRDNKCLEFFKVDFQPEMLNVKGEVLAPPVLSYGRPGSPDQKETVTVSGGKWNLLNKAFVVPQEINNWALISFLSPSRMNEIQELFQRYVLPGAERLNVKMATQPRMAENLSRLDDLDTLAPRLREMAAEGKRLDIIFVFIERACTAEYVKIKSSLDEITVTQVLTAEKTPLLNRKNKGVDGHVGNILSKVNMKRGGANHYINHNASAFAAVKMFLRDPQASCIIGCDVALRHTECPRSAVRDLIPSIAAMVCSLEPQCGRYLHSFRVQHAGTECVDELAGMITGLLSNRCRILQSEKWPSRVIFLRDGLSDGNMGTVSSEEIQRIYQAYQHANQPQPHLLYMSVRKRHQTRFFPQSSGGNMPPGTCVFDTLSLALPFPSFYLISHDGIKGTSRPARYVVLFDGLRDSTPDLKALTDVQLVKAYAHLAFQLCHLYGRCQRAVSVPAPIYYVNLLTVRARIHANGIVSERFGVGLISESGSQMSGEQPVSSIKDVVDVKEVEKTIDLLNKKLREIESAPMFFYC